MGWNFQHSYAKLPDLFYTSLEPTPVRDPRVVIYNESLGIELGLKKEDLSAEILAGNVLPDGAFPLAQAYAGHQFGYFTMLGDGRAVLLGEQVTPKGERFDIQLKGAGITPYSRGGDGRAAIGPMLREYIISEAMHALHIPTTRSLAVVTTGESVIRETVLPGGILTRVAKSHLRVGTFEYVAQWGNQDDIKVLADYTIDRHFPNLRMSEERYLLMLRAVIERQAALIASWQRVGFIHGVMNTDNMALSGETIDYGPCAFMDIYDPKTVFSSIDTQGRYAYENQPEMAVWNLARFAETLLPLLNENETEAVQLAQEEIQNFWVAYESHMLAGMTAKLGMFNKEEADQELIQELLTSMAVHEQDYTNTFYALTVDSEHPPIPELSKWHQRWQLRLSRQGKTKSEIESLMKAHNPSVIPRNHQVEKALEAATQGDLTLLTKLVAVLANPYSYTPDQDAYRHPLKGMKGCYQTFCGT